MRPPHQVGFGVGGRLVDLPEAEEALSVSNSTLQHENSAIRTIVAHRQNTDAALPVCVCVWMYLIALGVEIEPGDSGISSLSEANELLRSVPFKHSHTAVLSTSHV